MGELTDYIGRWGNVALAAVLVFGEGCGLVSGAVLSGVRGMMRRSHR